MYDYSSAAKTDALLNDFDTGENHDNDYQYQPFRS